MDLLKGIAIAGLFMLFDHWFHFSKGGALVFGMMAGYLFYSEDCKECECEN